MHKTGHSNTVYWANPEGLDGEAGGSGVSGWGTHVHPWLIHFNVWLKKKKKPLKYCKVIQFSSVQFSRSVVSNSLQPHELQHARPPCPSPTPGVYANSCPSSWWCHPAISSSVVPFSSCPQSLPTSGSFPMPPIKKKQKRKMQTVCELALWFVFSEYTVMEMTWH